MCACSHPEPIHLPSVESTNTWMLNQGGYLPHWTVVYTFNQTDGRGRRGRGWTSRPGETLAMSLRVPSFPADVPATWVPLLAGYSLVNVLDNLGLDKAQVKWPNDILVGSRKLAGVLVEASATGDLIVGVGINVFSDRDYLPDPHATSMVIEGVEIVDSVESLIVPFRNVLHRVIYEGIVCDSNEQVAFWAETVKSALGTIGSPVKVVGDDGIAREGTAEGLGPSGQLIVRTDDGFTLALHSGDVFHIPRS